MAWRETGNPPQFSTTSLQAGASTTALYAVISTLAAGPYEVRWILGGSTNAAWALEQSTGTAVDAASQRAAIYVFTSPNQSAQFVTTHQIETGDILRARITSTVALIAAQIQAERLV